ncbi:MAG: TraB/GumN family protein [Sphaerochaetaceae bacterium]|nr:TraB/GumN family protein [Sphaerochaetaceae bacterium]
MTIEQVSDTVRKLHMADGREIILVGTAHVSKDSVDEVAATIETERPDHVCIELDKGRYQTKTQGQSWSNMNVSKVLKEGKGFLLLANMALSSFQKRMGAQTGSAPGEEIIGAAHIAEEKGIPFSFCDREIQVTLKRAWRKSNLWNKAKLMATLISAAFSKEEISEEELEQLKQSDILQTMMDEMAKELPTVKEVLIDERDRFLATSIYEAPGKKIVAVIGAGHANGIIATMEKLERGTISTDLTEISDVPPSGKAGKIIAWAIPTIIVGIIIFGFVNAGWTQGLKMFLYWVAVNAAFTGIAAIISWAHPLNWIVSMVAAPFTSLNPTIGVGIVSGILEANLRKPQVKDFEGLSDDALTFKGWYRNRVLHALLVFFMTSVGSMVGTFVGFPVLVGLLAK